MCSINSQGDCVNKYCSCPYIHDISGTKKWLVYEVEERSICNQVIGWFINLWRAPSKYPKPLTKEETRRRKEKTDEMRRRYGLLEDDNAIELPTDQ